MKTTVILLVDFNLGDGIGDTVHLWNLYLYLKKLGYKVSALSFGINKTMTSFNNCFLNGKDHDGEGFYTVLTDCSLNDLYENGSIELIVNQTLNDLKNRKITFADEEYSYIGFVSTSFTSYGPLYEGVLEGLIKDKALTIGKKPQFFSFLDYASSTKPVGNASCCLVKIPGDLLQRIDFYPFITINNAKFFVKETVMGINPVGLLLTGEVDKLKDIIQKNKKLDIEIIQNESLQIILKELINSDEDFDLGYGYLRDVKQIIPLQKMLISIVGVQSKEKNKNSTLVVTGAEIPSKLIQELADKLKINILFNQPELSTIDTYNPSDMKTTLILSIVWFKRLPYQDTLHLMAHSKWLVGSGDSSLGELIVTSHYRSSPPLPLLFLYDFKRAVLQELYLLAKKQGLNNLRYYLSQIMLKCCPEDQEDKLENIDKVFETLLQYKEESFNQILNEWKQICKIIYENHNVQKYIKEEFSLFLDVNINVIDNIIDESIENKEYKTIANQSPLEIVISGDYEEEFILNCISKYEKSNILIDDISKLLCLCILINNEKIVSSLLKCNISNLSVSLVHQGYKALTNLGPNKYYDKYLDPFSFALAEKNKNIINQLFCAELFVYVLQVFNMALTNFNFKAVSLLFPKYPPNNPTYLSLI